MGLAAVVGALLLLCTGVLGGLAVPPVLLEVPVDTLAGGS